MSTFLFASTAIGAASAQAGVADNAIVVTTPGGPYLAGDDFPVTISITNHGTVADPLVKVSSARVSGSDSAIGLGVLRQGVRIEPGATFELTTTGKVYQWSGAPVVDLRLYSNADRNPRNNTARVTPPVLDPGTVSGSLDGTVFGDLDADGLADPGEGLAGVHVLLYDASANPPTTVTAADGTYSFPALPARRYEMRVFDAPGGWLLQWSRSVAVDGVEHLDVVGSRPVSEVLDATITLDQNLYQVGDTGVATVVLTNRSGTDLTDVVVWCDRGGMEQHFTALTTGDLATGVTVPANSSRSFTITGVVPANAAQYATVVMYCDFGPVEQGRSEAFTTARVPAPPADHSGRVYQDLDADWTLDEGEAIAGLTVGLIDPYTDQEVATAVSDATGLVEYTAVPAGRYLLSFHGPWTTGQRSAVYVGTCWNCGQTWYLPLKPVS